MMGKREKNNWLEMVVLGLSGILVLFTVGYLCYAMIFEEQTSPEIVIYYGKIQHKPNYFALPITVVNKGSQTAENVRIEILGGNEESTDTSEIEFTYLPGKSSVTGWATFKRNPGKAIQVHILGYTSP